MNKRKKQNIADTVMGLVREKAHYQFMNPSNINQPVNFNKCNTEYHTDADTRDLSSRTFNNIPLPPPEPLTFRRNTEAYSFETSNGAGEYVRNYDMDKKPLFFQGRNSTTKFDSDEEYENTAEKARNNFGMNMPKSFASSVLGKAFDSIAEQRAEERREKSESITNRIASQTYKQYTSGGEL